MTVVQGQSAGIVLPGQVEKQFQKVPESRSKPGKFQFPQSKQEPPTQAAEIYFTLNRLIISGSTIYRDSEFQAYYQDFLGKKISLLDVYHIADQITVRYRNDGYILSQAVVPAQTIKDGEINLQVIEGYVSGIQYSDEITGFRRLVPDYAEKIKHVRPLTATALERYLLLMNDLPGAYSRATLVPSQTEQGAAELVITYVESLVSGGLSTDNRGAETFGPWRYSGDMDFNGVMGLHEKTSIRGVTTGDDELNFVSASHQQHLGSEGLKFNMGYSYVISNPRASDDTIVLLELQTESHSGYTGISYPLIRSRSENLYLRANFTITDSTTRLFDVIDTEDRIRAFRFGFTYDKADAWQGISIVDVEFSQGLNIFNGSSNGDFLLSRLNGQVDFSKVSLYAARLQSLWAPYWSLLTAVNAQYAFSDLLSPELFSYGGEQFGRGYDPSELVGDSGMGFKTELRFTATPQWALLNNYTIYSFYDYGVVSQRSVPLGTERTVSAASAGLGLKINFAYNVSAYTEITQPLTRVVSARDSTHARGYIGFSVRF